MRKQQARQLVRLLLLVRFSLRLEARSTPDLPSLGERPPVAQRPAPSIRRLAASTQLLRSVQRYGRSSEESSSMPCGGCMRSVRLRSFVSVRCTKVSACQTW